MATGEGGRTVRKALAAKSRKAEVEGFGCPRSDWPHHFRVTIPEVRGAEVRIVEDFGVAGHSSGQEEAERCIVTRDRWKAVADAAALDFNGRLRGLGLPPGTWKPGANKVERLLGMELVLLASAVAAADEADISAVVASWSSLRSEERWWFSGWLQSKGSERAMRGAALLLAGGRTVDADAPKRKSKAAPAPSLPMPLFDLSIKKR